VDEMHLAIAPVILGSGELLLAGLNLRAMGYSCREFVPGTNATHVVLARA
jgi:riboflavin biosynthesis pyrimidine reductase